MKARTGYRGRALPGPFWKLVLRAVAVAAFTFIALEALAFGPLWF